MTEQSRMEALYLAYRSASDRMPDVDFSYFVEFTKQWEVYPVYVDYEVVGAVLTIGSEIHACIADGYGKWLSRRVLKDTLHKVMEEYGFATTCAFTEAGQRFVERLGFVEMEPGQYVKVKNHGH